MTCELQASDRIALYFYGELDSAARRQVQIHLRQCAACRGALDDLAAIRAALASVPAVAAPPRGDWSAFMQRLDAAVQQPAARDVVSARRSGRQVSIRQLVPYLAMAAMLVLVTASIVLVQRSRPSIPPAGIAVSEALPSSRVAAAPDPGLLSASEQHFQRSKLVLLDLATRDVDAAVGGDWTFERSLATTLLDDTRLYRRAAEQRDMSALAGVMRDLELVLLQTSMSEAPDRDSVERLQRLIRQRDLLTKMVAYEDAPSGLWYDRDGAGGRPPAGRTRVRGQ